MSVEPAQGPFRGLLARMTADSLETSGLDNATLMSVRLAALAAVDAPPASYLLNLGAAAEIGLDSEDIRGILIAVAPIIGTARATAALTNMVEALGLEADLDDMAG